MSTNAPKRIDIPQSLLATILQERCVLFVGAGVSQETGLPSAQEIAARLARDCDYPNPRTHFLWLLSTNMNTKAAAEHLSWI